MPDTFNDLRSRIVDYLYDRGIDAQKLSLPKSKASRPRSLHGIRRKAAESTLLCLRRGL